MRLAVTDERGHRFAMAGLEQRHVFDELHLELVGHGFGVGGAARAGGFWIEIRGGDDLAVDRQPAAAQGADEDAMFTRG